MHPSNMTSSQAVEIIRQYADLIGKARLDGKTVNDTTMLSHSKAQILASAALLNALSKDPTEKASLAEMARALAFFQPNTEGAKPALSSKGPEDQTWESIVCAEMQSIDAYLQNPAGAPPKF